ncbi:MAG: SDR family oxidoreductase [Flavipsychrobacter sp.]|nr:SDR family oxidoreductase [Flavipsychrobacter sp.]
MYSFQDKVVAITGASSGIGQALAAVFLNSGAKVAACARNLPRLREAFSGLDSTRLYLVSADVSNEQDCKAFVEGTIAHWGRIDVLINNAGTSMRALFDELDLSVLKELMDINFWGTVYCTKYALPSIMQNKGIIVGVSSIAGYRGLPARTGYSASKFAMHGFLEGLRTEMLHTGTHVMWVCPGFTASNIRNVARSADGSAQGDTPLEEGKLMSAEECARIIKDAMAARKRTIVMTGQGKLTVWMNKLFPALADKLVYKHFLKEPGSPLQKYER